MGRGGVTSEATKNQDSGTCVTVPMAADHAWYCALSALWNLESERVFLCARLSWCLDLRLRLGARLPGWPDQRDSRCTQQVLYFREEEDVDRRGSGTGERRGDKARKSELYGWSERWRTGSGAKVAGVGVREWGCRYWVVSGEWWAAWGRRNWRGERVKM